MKLFLVYTLTCIETYVAQAITMSYFDHSSSSSSSSSSDDDMIIAMGGYLNYKEQRRKQSLCLLQLTQAATELPPSASRARAKKRRIRRDREAAYDRLYKDYR